MQWVSCASSRLTVWLQGLKVRDLFSTPVSRAILETSCSGIRLQIWRKTLNRLRVGLMVFWFFIPAVWQVQNVKPTLFFIFCGTALEKLTKPNSTKNEQTVRIPELDGLRGAAILLVLIWHFGSVFFAGAGKLPGWAAPFKSLMGIGW